MTTYLNEPQESLTMKRRYLPPFFKCQRFSIKNQLLTSSSEDLGDDLWGDGDDLFDDEPETPYDPEGRVDEDVDIDD